MNYVLCNVYATLLLKNCNVLKFTDMTTIASYIFVNKGFINNYFSIFTKSFQLISVAPSYNTKSGRNGLLFVPNYNSVKFERKSMIHSVTLTWDHLQDKFAVYDFF